MKNKPYYTSSLRVLEIAKIGLSENLKHLPREQGTDLTQSCDKTPTPTEQSKKQCGNIKTPPITSITQLLRTDLGRSVGVTATQLVWLNRFTSAQASFSPTFPDAKIPDTRYFKRFPSAPSYNDLC